MSTTGDHSSGAGGRVQQAPGLRRADLQQQDLSVPGSGGNAAELATYVVEKGKPLLMLAE